jgi:hypothetical protein
MLVIVKNTPVELPDLEAEILLHRGIAHLPEVADLPMGTRYSESSGIPTPPSFQQGMARKPRKPSQGSSKKVTK